MLLKLLTSSASYFHWVPVFRCCIFWELTNKYRFKNKKDKDKDRYLEKKKKEVRGDRIEVTFDLFQFNHYTSYVTSIISLNQKMHIYNRLCYNSLTIIYSSLEIQDLCPFLST